MIGIYHEICDATRSIYAESKRGVYFSTDLDIPTSHPVCRTSSMREGENTFSRAVEFCGYTLQRDRSLTGISHSRAKKEKGVLFCSPAYVLR